MPNQLNETSHWMVTGTWLQAVAPPSQLITSDNPSPNRPIIIPVTMTEFIAVHPSRYVLAMQRERAQYAIVWSQQIHKDTFDEIQKLSAAVKATQGNGNF